jgi:hypothetical protein
VAARAATTWTQHRWNRPAHAEGRSREGHREGRAEGELTAASVSDMGTHGGPVPLGPPFEGASCARYVQACNEFNDQVQLGHAMSARGTAAAGRQAGGRQGSGERTSSPKSCVVEKSVTSFLPGVITPAQPGGRTVGNFQRIPCKLNGKWVAFLWNRWAKGPGGAPGPPELASLVLAARRRPGHSFLHFLLVRVGRELVPAMPTQHSVTSPVPYVCARAHSATA